MSKARELAELGAVYDGGALSNRNMVINGAMQVAQRGTSSTGLGASSGYFTVDRFAHNFNSTSGRITSTQESITDLPGFNKALKVACTTADTSLGAAEYFTISQSLEGSDVQRLKKGTSSAEKVTVSFYVKGNAAATYAFELQDQSSREISQLFSVTTSWNRVVLTFIADTSGGITNTNTYGLGFSFFLAAGSNFNSGSSGDLNTTWNAVGSDGSRAAGISNFLDSTSRTLFITGVQIEVGESATPFEHRSFADELARCQRYFYQENTTGSDASGGLGVAAATTAITFDHPLPVIMRANPSVSLTSADLRVGDTVSQGFTTSSGSISISSYCGSARGVYNLNGFSGLTIYRTYLHEPDATHPGIVMFNAEL